MSHCLEKKLIDFFLCILAQLLPPDTDCQNQQTPQMPGDVSTTTNTPLLTSLQNLMATAYIERVICKGAIPTVLQINSNYVVFIEESYYGVSPSICDKR